MKMWSQFLFLSIFIMLYKIFGVDAENSCVAAPNGDYGCIETDRKSRLAALEKMYGEKQLKEWLDIGTPQRVEGSDVEKENVREVIKKMDEYWVDEVLSFPQYEGVRGKCKNTNELCAFWASVNECENNRVFMMHSCAVACRFCLLAAPH
mmetsp:Transcript_20458/g.28908  ORF Transcript_20458/g.28908 Transcript_20458/m.28908 type:complete len:150 (+) Transcript_20458:290-739(+)